MGRPVKKDVNGVAVFGDYTNGAVGIKCEAYIGGSNQADVFIVKQKGSRSYYVQDKSTGTKVAAKLVSGQPAAAGEMRLTGYTAGGPDASATAIAKLLKRTAIDFAGNRYTWFLDNDSSADQIILKAL
jgi:hypothetical protein